MKAHPGDHITLAATHIDEPTRDGEILEVRGADSGPPYVVRWSDGHTGYLFPAPGAVLSITSEGQAAEAGSTDAEE